MTTKEPKKTSPAVRGAQLYNKILELRSKRDAEIANAPVSIAERFAAREQKIASGYSEEERTHAENLLNPPSKD